MQLFAPGRHSRLLTSILVALDGAAMAVAVWLAFRLRFDPASLEIKSREFWAHPTMILLSLAVAWLAAALAGLYRPVRFSTRIGSAMGALGAAGIALLGIYLLQALSPYWQPGRGILLLSSLFWAGLLFLSRRAILVWAPADEAAKPPTPPATWEASMDDRVLSVVHWTANLLKAGWSAGEPRGMHPAPQPLSHRIVDGATAIFALWTVTCHAVVSYAGVFQNLLTAWALVLPAAIWCWWKFRHPRRADTGAATGAQEVWAATATWEMAEPVELGLARARAVGLLIAAAALAVFAFSDDWIVRWSAVFAVLLVGLGAQLALEDPELPFTQRPPNHLGSERWLWILVLLSVIVSLVAHRPDFDDALYVNFAVSALDLPQWQLLRTDVLHGIPDLPLHLSLYQLHSIELWNAFLSWLTGLTPIQTFHWLGTAMGAALIPLVGARLFRELVPQVWTWAVSFYVLILLTLGETHRWYGNFAFVRIWQGKGVFLFIFLPLVWIHGMALGRRPNLRNWSWLAASMIAAVGASSTALWVAPATALMAVSVVRRPTLRTLGVLLLALSSSGYLLISALMMKGEVARVLAERKPRQIGEEFVEAVGIVFGDSRLVIASIAVLLVAWVLAPSRPARRFALVSCLAVWAILLNPFTSSWIVGNVTGAAYWRAFWALPLPVLMSLVLVAPLGWKRIPAWLRIGISLAAAGVLTFYVPGIQILSSENRVAIRFPPELKVSGAYEQAELLNQLTLPYSNVVAPRNAGAWVTTFRHHVHPVSVRSYLRYSPDNPLTAEEVEAREAMTAYASGFQVFTNGDGDIVRAEAVVDYFDKGLDRFNISAVCLHLWHHRDAETAREILRRHEFSRVVARTHFEIWLREPPDAEPSA